MVYKTLAKMIITFQFYQNIYSPNFSVYGHESICNFCSFVHKTY
jgi:hypothetical protein